MGAAKRAVVLLVYIIDKSEEGIIDEWLLRNLLLFLTVFNYQG